MKSVKGLLIDLDGTLYFRGAAIEGANAALRELREQGYALRFLTNTDSIHAPAIFEKVVAMGLREVRSEEIYCPSVAVLRYFEQHPEKTCYCLVSKELDAVFGGLPINAVNPDCVVVGDCRDKVSYDELNKVFRMISQGAELLVTSKAGFFFNSEGIQLDTGAFVALLEYASGKTAQPLGKPSRVFFETALGEMKLKPEEVAIVGDDINTDIVGAINIGSFGVLLKTGKFRDEHLLNPAVQAHHVIDSIRDLPGLLGRAEYE